MREYDQEHVGLDAAWLQLDADREAGALCVNTVAPDICTYCLQELAERTAAGRPLNPLNSLIGTPHAHSKGPIPCHFFHPGQTCVEHPLKLFLPAYERALSVYLPVYVLPALLVHRQELLKQPLPILHKLLFGIAR